MADHEITNHQMRPLARNLQAPPPPKFFSQSNQSRFQFKSKPLQFNRPQKARIGTYENGPFSFFVQLQDQHTLLENLQDHLKRVPLKPMNSSSISMLGLACLIRRVNDNSIFRAAIAKFPQRAGETEYIVNLVDYGSNIAVNIEHIFMIPADVAAHLTFAIPCRLSDVRKSSQVSEREISALFKSLTDNKVITIKCVQSDDSPICQICDIFIDENINVADILNNWNPYQVHYSTPSTLESNSIMSVKVSYVESPNEFYVHVQTSENQSDYDKTCEELYKAIPQLVVMENPKNGNCCAVLLSNELYRGLVLSKTTKGLIRVKIIDYGITEEFPPNHVFCLPQNLAHKAPFSYECCLDGFEDLKVSDNVSTQFDIFCGDGRGDRKIFKMIISKSGEKSIVKLEDSTVDPPLNVNSMLLKNSRPLMETIQLENSKKKQRDSKSSTQTSESENHSDSQNRNIRRKNTQRENTQKGSQSADDKIHRKLQNSFNKSESPDENRNGTSPSDGNVKINTSKNDMDIKVGWVSTILSCNRVFVHYEEHIASLEKILDDMFSFYENKQRTYLKELKVGKLCAARSIDSNWYRSRVEQIKGDIVEVTHCEYGNMESLHKSKLRALDDRFINLGELVVPAYFAIQPGNEKSLLEELKLVFDEGSKCLQFKRIGKFHDGWILEPIDMKSNQNIIDELVREKKAERISSEKLFLLLNKQFNENYSKIERKKTETPHNKQSLNSKNVKSETGNRITTDVKNPNTSPPKPHKCSQVRISALTSATDFFTIDIKDVKDYQKLHSDIQIISSGMGPLIDFNVSTFCLLKQPFDQQYYRAQVIYNDDIVTVRCVDDGKTFSVDKKLLKQMPEALKGKKFFATASSLCVNVSKAKDEESTDFLLQMVDKIFYGEVLCISVGKTYFELFHDQMKLSDELVSKKLVSRIEIISPGDGFTSHINSLSSFFLQMECDQLKLDAISKYFEDAKGDFDKVEGNTGQIVAALFKDDGCWYRAKIENKQNDKYSVAFIDFGNICEVDKIGMLEDAIANLPRMSKHCSLHIPEQIRSTLPPNADEKVKTLCANGETILQVNMIKPGDPIEVDIVINGVNLLDLLLEKQTH